MIKHRYSKIDDKLINEMVNELHNNIMQEDKKFVITINDYDGRYSDRSTTRIVDKDQLSSILAKTAPNKILALHELGPSIALKPLEL